MMAKLLLLLQSQFFSLKVNLHIEKSDSDLLLHADTMLCMVDSDTFGYVLYNKSEKNIYKWKVCEYSNLSDFSSILNQEFKAFPDHISVNILNYHPRYQAIPSIFRTENKHLDFWELSTYVEQDEQIIEDVSVDKDICFLHAVHKKIYEEINQRFSKLRWYSLQSIQFMNPIYQSDKVIIQLIFLYKLIHVSVYSKGKILLVKAYPLSNPEDILWYLMNVVTGLGYSNEDVVLYPEGFVDTQSSLFNLLDQYFDRVNFQDQLQYQFPETDLDLSSPTLIHIDRILSCVS